MFVDFVNQCSLKSGIVSPAVNFTAFVCFRSTSRQRNAGVTRRRVQRNIRCPSRNVPRILGAGKEDGSRFNGNI